MTSYMDDHGDKIELETVGLARGLAYSLLGAFEL